MRTCKHDVQSLKEIQNLQHIRTIDFEYPHILGQVKRVQV